jgi:hypothetical protein
MRDPDAKDTMLKIGEGMIDAPRWPLAGLRVRYRQTAWPRLAQD